MKNLLSGALISVAILVVPRDPHEAAVLAAQAAIALIRISMQLDGHWYDAGYDTGPQDQPSVPQQDA